MTFRFRLFDAVLLAAAVLLTACAGNASKKDATPAATPAAPTAPADPRDTVSTTPQPAPIPGGYWPPLPDSEATPIPAPVLGLSTDAIDLKAKRDPKADLEHRVIERWALLIAKQGDLAFDYLSPGYQKSHDRVNYQKEMAERPVRWLRVAYSKAECLSELSCKVTSKMDYKIRTAGMGAGPSELSAFAYLSESWLQVDGVWYHLPGEIGG